MKKTLFFLPLLVFTLHAFGQSLKFNGTNSYIKLTSDSVLHLTAFTIEAWIKPLGTGVTTTTGTGGITAVPILSKGRGEGDAPDSININYFLGLDKDKRLRADFEQPSGSNYPIVSNSVIKDSIWTHVAVSYEPVSAVWKMYINGVLDVAKDLGSNITPVNTSIQPAAIATAINSTGAAAGYFDGNIDEVRIWKVVRTGADIFNNYRNELTNGTGLVARYALNEGKGIVAANSISTAGNGKLVNNPLWTTGYTSPPIKGFSSVSISSGWNQAVGLTFNKAGDKMFVWEKGGKVWVVENNQKKLFLDISPEVGDYSVMGLMGFALHPQFETNGYFYLLYTVDRHHLLYYGTSKYSATANEYNRATIGRVTRYTATRTSAGYKVDTLTRKVLIGATKSTGIPNVLNAHHVNNLVFGTDGTLFVSAGDGGTPSVTDTGSTPGTFYKQALADSIITPQENVGAFRCQLLQSYNGKILRIDPETGNGIPGNPFYETAHPGSVKSKVWALGLRNPFRMSLKPGTGSSNPADGNPGVLYVGDVGWTEAEEIDVVDKPGMNFGWPLFEGLTEQPLYGNTQVYNYYAPNPLYGINGCRQKYFYFKDLIKQETASGSASFTNPCNTSRTIPANIKTFVHSRPVIDWMRGTGPSRTGSFSGETATVTNIGAPGSPVSGPQFGGACVTGGVFYTHTDFPNPYRNTYFFADYVNRWIRAMKMDENNKPVKVSRHPVDSGSRVVFMALQPFGTGIYYINYSSEIRKIVYNNANQPPVAVASSSVKYGPSPLSVPFTGEKSYDPDGKSLTYLWDFGDGAISTLANPSHTFTAATGAPAKFTVKLTVKDAQGSTGSTKLIISANNTPPEVTITSPLNGSLYSPTADTRYNLRATVTDKESRDDKLSYQWQSILHHADHEHPDPVDTSRITTTTIAPLGCGTEVYYYRVVLTVTDPGGLSTTREVKLYPNCNQRVVSLILVNADNGQNIKTLSPGDTINLADLPGKNLNIRANTNPSTVGSVAFNLTGTETRSQTENSLPYVLFGDTNKNYNPWTPSSGSYSLQATPYSGFKGTGTAGSTLIIDFTVTNQSAARLALKTGLGVNERNETGFSVSFYPNPFQPQFTLRILNKGENKVPVKMYDAQGRTVLHLQDVQARQRLVLGNELTPGMYVLEVGTGNKAKRYKLIKIAVD